MMVCTCEILAGGVNLVKSNLQRSEICLILGGVLFWSTHIHTPYRLDKLHSALAEARLKTINVRIVHILSYRSLVILRIF